MWKFESDHNVLEILSHSKYLPGHLNHQVIAIMSSMGVPDLAFLDLQASQVQHLSTLAGCVVCLHFTTSLTSLCQVSQLNKMTLDLDSALSVLLHKATPLHSRLSDMLWAGMLCSGNLIPSSSCTDQPSCPTGFSTQEPFLQNCLQAIRKGLLLDIKQKARIFVPQVQQAVPPRHEQLCLLTTGLAYGQSRNLLGVLDETNTLEYGQVFLQYSATVACPHSTEFRHSEYSSKVTLLSL